MAKNRGRLAREGTCIQRLWYWSAFIGVAGTSRQACSTVSRNLVGTCGSVLSAGDPRWGGRCGINAAGLGEAVFDELPIGVSQLAGIDEGIPKMPFATGRGVSVTTVRNPRKGSEIRSPLSNLVNVVISRSGSSLYGATSAKALAIKPAARNRCPMRGSSRHAR